MNDIPSGMDALLEAPPVKDVVLSGGPWILALDYDGTLAPFRPERDLATPYPELSAVLQKLPVSGPRRFLIVSGRECGSVKRLLGVTPHPEIWGCHGLERLLPDGETTLEPLKPHQKRALTFAMESIHDSRYVEVKPCSVAVHWRGLDDAARADMERRYRPLLTGLAESSELVLHAFDGGLELRPPGPGKGGAIAALTRENPDSAIFFLGDDATDEDGFSAIGANGLGILVKDSPRPTKASYRLSPPGELLRFLQLFIP